MDNELRLERLRNLRAIVLRHAQSSKLFKTKLNGERRRFDMMRWDCGSSACALGSYVLSEYGTDYRREYPYQFVEIPGLFWGSKLVFIGPGLSVGEHFGITWSEASQIFEPSHYTMHPIPPSAVIRKINSLIDRYERS